VRRWVSNGLGLLGGSIAYVATFFAGGFLLYRNLNWDEVKHVGTPTFKYFNGTVSWLFLALLTSLIVVSLVVARYARKRTTEPTIPMRAGAVLGFLGFVSALGHLFVCILVVGEPGWKDDDAPTVSAHAASPGAESSGAATDLVAPQQTPGKPINGGQPPALPFQGVEPAGPPIPDGKGTLGPAPKSPSTRLPTRSRPGIG
jgi:hypothetical protein